jgi:hypothetical protein
VPRSRGRDEIESVRRGPGLKISLDDLGVGIGGQLSLRDRRQILAELDAHDAESSLGRRPSCLARGAADLEDAIAALQPSHRHQHVKELRRVLRPSAVIQLSRRIKGAPEIEAIIHGSMIALGAGRAQDLPELLPLSPFAPLSLRYLQATPAEGSASPGRVVSYLSNWGS